MLALAEKPPRTDRNRERTDPVVLTWDDSRFPARPPLRRTTIAPRAGVVLDLSHVRCLDAAGALAVARIARRVRAAGGLLCLGGASSTVCSRLVAAGLGEVAEIHPTCGQALAAARLTG